MSFRFCMLPCHISICNFRGEPPGNSDVFTRKSPGVGEGYGAVEAAAREVWGASFVPS